MYKCVLVGGLVQCMISPRGYADCDQPDHNPAMMIIRQEADDCSEGHHLVAD